MGILHNEKDQLEISFEKSNESTEVLSLISEAKNGNEQAWEELLKMFNKLIHGKYIKSLLKFDFDKDPHKKDIYSILNLIFVEAVNSYEPKLSKFITHLTTSIRFKFWGHFLKERPIPIRNNRSTKEIKKELNESQCNIYPTIFDYIEGVAIKEEVCVSFKLGEQEFNVPIEVFIQKFLYGRAKEIVPKEDLDIFIEYLNLTIEGHSDVFKQVSNKYKVKRNRIHYLVSKYSKLIGSGLEIEDIKINSR